MRVDRVEVAGEAELHKGLQHRVADAARLAAGAHHRDGTGREQWTQRRPFGRSVTGVGYRERAVVDRREQPHVDHTVVERRRSGGQVMRHP